MSQARTGERVRETRETRIAVSVNRRVAEQLLGPERETLEALERELGLDFWDDEPDGVDAFVKALPRGDGAFEDPDGAAGLP